jgi:DNA-binding transcriptional LysR family regulator
MDWDKLKTFYYVVKAGGITASGPYLHLSQPAISRQIKNLEYSLKKALFLRRRDGCVLTEEGEVLYSSVKKMIEEAEYATSRIFAMSDEPTGEIKITTTNALASSWLPRYVPTFLEQYPNISFTIIGNDQDLDLKTREADVAIRTYAENQPDLVQDYLSSFHLGLYASEKYLQKHGIPKKVQDLDNHRLLSFGEYKIHPYGNINWCLTVGAYKDRKPFLSINSSQGLHLMAENGLGIAALSKEYASNNTKLVRILPHVDGPKIDIYYVYPTRLKEIKRIAVLGEFLRNELKKDMK